MGILNYTTDVLAEKSIQQIQSILARFDVSAVMTEYDGPHVAGLSFKIRIEGQSRGFRLPCNWKAVHEIMYKKSRMAYQDKQLKAREAQAIRVTWRVLKDWVEAQMALIEINAVTVQQIFLPYAIMKDGRTLSEHVESDPSLLLGSGQQQSENQV